VGGRHQGDVAVPAPPGTFFVVVEAEAGFVLAVVAPVHPAPTAMPAGYWWDISMRQFEVAKTITFTAPRHARAFFEALTADNLDIGLPDNMEIIFNRQVRSTTKASSAPPPTATTTAWW
jgi:hypothetical protein